MHYARYKSIVILKLLGEIPSTRKVHEDGSRRKYSERSRAKCSQRTFRMFHDRMWQYTGRDIPRQILQPVPASHRLGLPGQLAFSRAWAQQVSFKKKQPFLPASPGSQKDWNPVLHSREFCQNTSLHGLQYVGENGRHCLERLFWLGAFIVAMVTAALLIHNLWTKWDENPVIVSFSTSASPITDIPFPAITVCNMNNARRSVAESILASTSNHPDLDVERYLLGDICNITLPSSGKTNSLHRDQAPQWDSIKEFLIKVNEPCHELLLSCQWAGSVRNCSDLFNSALMDEGLCCQFNRLPRDLVFRNPQDVPDLNITFPFPAIDWSPDVGYPPGTPKDTLPWRSEGAGKHLGLTVVLDLEVHEYFCSSTASAGLKMLLHSPVETPKMSSFGYAMSPGSEDFVVIQPKVMQSSMKIGNVKTNKRHCFFSHERSLRFYRSYTKYNCALECEANYTLHKCGCVEYFMPKDKTTRICGKTDDECTENARGEAELHLYDERTSSQSRGDQDEVSASCHCLPGCNELTYSAQKTSSMLVDTFAGNAMFQLKGKGEALRNITYFKENAIVIHFFFMDMQVVAYSKNEMTGFVDFLASTGGLLGLFHGFSVLSAVEVLYYLSLRLFCSWRNKGRNKKVIKPAGLKGIGHGGRLQFLP